MARETAIVQIAGTFSRSGWSQVGRYGRSAIIRIQNAGIPVAIVHLIRSHVWRFLIEVSKNWSVSISPHRPAGGNRDAPILADLDQETPHVGSNQVHDCDRNPRVLDPDDRTPSVSPDLAPPAPRERPRNLDDRGLPRHRGLSVAQPPLLPTSRHPARSRDVREGAGEARSGTPHHPEQCTSNRQTEGVLSKPVLGVQVGRRQSHFTPPCG